MKKVLEWAQDGKSRKFVVTGQEPFAGSYVLTLFEGRFALAMPFFANSPEDFDRELEAALGSAEPVMARHREVEANF